MSNISDKEIMPLIVFLFLVVVCLSVCLSVSNIIQKVMNAQVAIHSYSVVCVTLA